MFVTVSHTASGSYLPVYYWGNGENMDREAYGMHFTDPCAAATAAEIWAKNLGVEYRPATTRDPVKVAARIERIKQLKANGMDTIQAIRQTRLEFG